MVASLSGHVSNYCILVVTTTASKLNHRHCPWKSLDITTFYHHHTHTMSSRSKRSAAKDPASVTSESDHGKSKKSKTTTTKSQQHATKNDSIEPAGIVPSYRPSEWASPMISTNIKGARKSGRIIVQTEKGRKYYADSDNEEEEKISKPSIGGMGEASKARKNGGKKKGSSPSSAQPPSSKIVDSAADGGEVRRSTENKESD